MNKEDIIEKIMYWETKIEEYKQPKKRREAIKQRMGWEQQLRLKEQEIKMHGGKEGYERSM